MTPLFPEKGQLILIKQKKAGDCYLLCSLDCVLNGGTENRDIVESRFTQTPEGVILRIKRTDQSKNLNPEKMNGKYSYSYDAQTDEDVIFIDNKKLEAIDNDPNGVESNALAVKILEHISSYFYVGYWDNDAPSASLDAHSIPQRYKESSTVFVGKLLGLEAVDTQDINAIIKLKAMNPHEPIYISMDYGNKDASGVIHGRHALRIEQITPMQNGDYQVVLVNPWDNTKQEIFTLSEIKTRHSRFSIFDTGLRIKNLINQGPALEQLPEPNMAKALLFLRKTPSGVEYYEISCSDYAEAQAIQRQLKALDVFNSSQLLQIKGFWRIDCSKSTMERDSHNYILEAIEIYKRMPQNQLIQIHGMEPKLFIRKHPDHIFYEVSCSSHAEAKAIQQQLKTLSVHSSEIIEVNGFWRINCDAKTVIKDAKETIERVLQQYEAPPPVQGLGPRTPQAPLQQEIGTYPLPQAYQPITPIADPQQAAQFNPGSQVLITPPTSPISFKSWIVGLDDRKAVILSDSLHSLGKQFNLNLMLQEMKPLSPLEESQLLFILSNYKVEYRGGTNSKNLLVINALTGEKEILKLEHRMGNPNTHVQSLQSIPDLQEYFVPVHFSKTVVITKGNTGQNKRCLQITDFCPGNDLSTKANMRLSDAERLAAAGNIYSQMANALVRMEQNATFYMDMKNSNWLLDENGMLKIADTKSLCPAQLPFPTYGLLLNLSMLSSNGYKWLKTNYISPPEVSNWNTNPDEYISVGHAEAFMFGKNLYEFLAATPPSRSTNEIQLFMEQHTHANAYDFSAPVFQTPVGKRYVSLIQLCIRENPAERFNIFQVQQAIHAIRSLEQNPQVLTTYQENYNNLYQMQNKYPSIAIEIANQMTTWENKMHSPLLTNHDIAFINEAMQTYAVIIDTMQHPRERYKNDKQVQQALDQIRGSLNKADLNLGDLIATKVKLNELIHKAEQAFIQQQQQQTFETLTHKLKENYGHLPQIRDNLAQIENKVGFYAFMPLEDINNFLGAMVNAMELSNANANMATNQQQPSQGKNTAAANPYSFLAGTLRINKEQEKITTNANEPPPDMETHDKYPK
ncbi:MAG: hypothetical protein P4L79_06185 [Legionella sp.]|uniref:protein kinase domain-containing protein n=1 Tax=Legionella sp. TaxID=459 RepID=UPI002847611D|nr:hypothetical protein [Legionella sp.]